MTKQHVVSCLAVVALVAATTNVSAQTAAAAVPTTYGVGPDDVIKITVIGEPDMSGSFKVNADGTINYWRLGRLDVLKKTVRQIEVQITTELLNGYLRKPQVSVEVEQFRSRNVFVMGEVVRPSKYSLSGETSLLEVLMTMAGGPTAAAGSIVRILAPKAPLPGGPEPVLPDSDQIVERATFDLKALRAGQITTNIVLQDGDTIFVPPAERFFISGEVKNVGNHVLEKGMTVGQAIIAAGGLTDKGSNRGIKIRRLAATGKDAGKYITIDVKLTDPVQPGDEIIVRKRRI